MSVFKDEPGPGHNSGTKAASNVAGVASEDLKSIVGRVESLNEDKASIASDIKEIFAEAKGKGYNVKVLRALIARRKQDAAALEEFETTLELYEGVFG